MNYFIKQFKYAFSQEFYRSIKDSAVIFSFFIISYIVAITYTYLYSNEVVQEAPIVIIDQCQSTESRQFIRMIDASEQVKVVYQETDLLQAKNLFYQNKVKGIVLIPSDFSQKIYQGQRPFISGYYDTAYFIYYKQVYKAVAMATTFFNAGIQLKSLTAQGMSESQAFDTITPIKPQVVTLYNPNAGYATFAMPMIYLIIIQTLMLTGIGLLGGTAREKNEFLSLHFPIQRISDSIAQTLGKATFYYVVGLLYICIILGIVMPLFSIPQRGNWIEIVIFLTPFIGSISFLGLWIIRFFKHREDAVMSIAFTSIPAMILSGVSWPKEAFPYILQIFSDFIPTTLAIKGFIALTQAGLNLENIKDIWFKLYGLSLLYFIFSVIFLYRSAIKKRRE